MAGSFKTTVKDKGHKRIIDQAKKFKDKPHVMVGILEAAGDHGEGLTVADVATFNEFGTENIPERSFLRSTADKNEKIYVDGLRRLHDAILAGKETIETALAKFGEKVVADIRRKIQDGVDPENSPATIAKKGSSKPLIDSGQLVQSIAYEVKK